jgi:hypothetical protein
MSEGGTGASRLLRARGEVAAIRVGAAAVVGRSGFFSLSDRRAKNEPRIEPRGLVGMRQASPPAPLSG